MFGVARAAGHENRHPNHQGGHMRFRHAARAMRLPAAIATALLAGAAAAAPLYTVTRIAPHDPRQWVDIEGVALNQVGGVAGTDLTHGRPFRWSAAVGLEWLEDLPGGEEHEAQAWDINDAGVVVG